MILRRVYKVLRHTGAIKIFFAYLGVLLIGGVLLRVLEPFNYSSVWQGIWYCFVASTTIGFGDLVAATVLGKIITIVVTIFGILTVAMVPGVAVGYYMEYLKAKENETISTFLEKLDHLPDLSHEELVDLSDRVKAFKKRNKM